MSQTYNLLLFIITLTGGSLPLWVKWINTRNTHYLLTFSGSFLLSITFLHLLPESFAETGNIAGIYLIAGFFLQLVIQKMTHGLEHGHVHIEDNTSGHHHIPLISILTGLTIHAFMEGLPLGFHYIRAATGPSLYFAVAAHKLPAAMLVTTLVYHNSTKKRALIFLTFFSLITPLASIIAHFASVNYRIVADAPAILLPLVAGAFIHIATTIFFESGTRQHKLSLKKVFTMLLGLGMGLLTLIF